MATATLGPVAMRRAAGPVALALLAAATVGVSLFVVRAWGRPGTDRPGAGSAAPASGWSVLGAQARCDSALGLVTQPDPWPTACRWRQASDTLQGASFPPPRGDPPFDDPHIEIYVDPAQTREEVAHALAHELGHMRHTRQATFGPEWIAARGLAPDTPPGIWTEDYAEVFAALFSPPSDRWRAPTPRPGAAELAVLRARFFSSP